jgi:tetratricopeptide (TPR) repeat protein
MYLMISPLGGAIGKCNKLLGSQKTDRELINRLFDLTGDATISMDDIRKLNSENPEKVIYENVESEEEFKLRHLALHMSLNRKFEKALDAADTAIQMNPNSAYTRYLRGSIYGNLCRWDEAIDEIKTALKLKHPYFRAQLELGILHFNKGIYEMTLENSKNKKIKKIRLVGEFKKAERQLKKAAEIDRCRQEPYEIMDWIYSLAGKPELAKINLEKKEILQ